MKVCENVQKKMKKCTFFEHVLVLIVNKSLSDKDLPFWVL